MKKNQEISTSTSTRTNSAPDLEIKDHPAMKEIGFRRFDKNGDVIEIVSESVLHGYMNEKDELANNAQTNILLKKTG